GRAIDIHDAVAATASGATFMNGVSACGTTLNAGADGAAGVEIAGYGGGGGGGGGAGYTGGQGGSYGIDDVGIGYGAATGGQAGVSCTRSSAGSPIVGGVARSTAPNGGAAPSLAQYGFGFAGGTGQVVIEDSKLATLSKAFSPTHIDAGQTSELTFTLTNHAGTPVAQTDLGFTDNLPSGLVLAGSPLIANTCGGSVTAAAATRVVRLSGGAMTAATSTCAVTVRVTTPPTPVAGVCTPTQSPALTNKKSDVIVAPGLWNGVEDTCLAVSVAYGAVSGSVFVDNGAGGGTANNGIRDGPEAPIAGAPMRLTNCAAPPATLVYASGVSDGTGRYVLDATAVPANAMVCVEQTNLAGFISTGVSLAGAALPAGYAYVRAGTPDHVSFQWQGTSVTRLDFGDVADNAFVGNGQQEGVPNSTVTYAHTFTATTTGKVVFSVSPDGHAEWATTVFDDPLCSGTLNAGAQQLYPPLGVGRSVTAGDKVCIVVRQLIPATAPPGDSHAAGINATFDYSNAVPALPLATYTLNDVTTVGLTALSLRKEVRNVSTSGPFAVSNQAKPGDELEYRITYTNNAPGAVTRLVINDTTPAYTTFVSSALGSTPAGLGQCTQNTPANPRPMPAVDCTAGPVQTPGGTGALHWVFDGALEAGASGEVLFRVKVD
ncbi:MAG: hypothetical protein QM639_12865, partial [Rhodocyclaceae bacterium]